jgi:hypothetical protein
MQVGPPLTNTGDERTSARIGRTIRELAQPFVAGICFITGVQKAWDSDLWATGYFFFTVILLIRAWNTQSKRNYRDE